MADMKTLVIDGVEYEIIDASVRLRMTDAESSITELQNEKADAEDIPTNVSDLTNDTGFITEVQVEDVTIDGTSVVSGKIAAIPRATDTRAGVVKIDPHTAADAQYLDIYAEKESGNEVARKVPLLDANNKVLAGQLPAATTSMQGALSSEDKQKINGMDTALAGKVDKEEGKGLSTIDYTAAEQTKLAGIETGANKYTHPTYTARTGKPTANAAPAFGGTFTVSQITSDASGHVTGATDRTVTIPSTVTSKTAAGLAPQLPNETTTTKYLRQDGTWVVPPNTTYGVATQSANGLMAAADKTKLDGVATGANKYTHPSYTARTGKPTANATPGFGSTFTVSQITSDASGHVTGATDRTVKIPNTAATTSSAGLMSAADKTKLDGISMIDLEMSGGAYKSIDPGKGSVLFSLPSEYRSGYSLGICEIVLYDSSGNDLPLPILGYTVGASFVFIYVYNLTAATVSVYKSTSRVRMIAIKN